MTVHGYRLRWYWLLLLALLIANVFVYWHSGRLTRGGFPAAPPDANGDGPGRGGFQEKMREALEKLPSGERAAIEQRLQADHQFFDSLRELAPDVRKTKIDEHFAKNPPPKIPGLALPPPPGGPGAPGPGGAGGNGSGDPGGRGGPESGHIPPPEIRRGMDQGIVDSLRKGTNP